jgi:hypothetical protein
MKKTVPIRWLLAVVASSLVAAGCGIATDDSPRDIEPRPAAPLAEPSADG